MASWRHCSSCRAEIDFEQTYWVCSVSTCARVARTGLFFCSVGCWEAHLPTMRHREAWAVEKRAPSRAAWQRQQAEESAAASSAPAARPASSGSRSSTGGSAGGSASASASGAAPARTAPARRVVAAGSDRVPADLAGDVLVVVSKLKKYIRARSGMNTSDGVTQVLSDHLRALCDLAARHAADDGRKTVLDRDFRAILRL